MYILSQCFCSVLGCVCDKKLCVVDTSLDPSLKLTGKDDQYVHCFVRLKKNKCYVSKLVTDWKTWPKCRFFCFVLFFFLSRRHVRFELVTTLKYGTWFWMNKIQDRTQSWRSLLFKLFHCVCHIVSLCLSYLFLFILTSKFIKNWKKNKQAKKIQTLDFAESNTHRKTNARGSFKT